MPGARPMGQIYIDKSKARIADNAAEHGWVEVSHEPLTFERGAKQVVVEFNSAGIPSKVTWTRGDEFSSMNTTGYVDLNKLDKWFAWKDPDA